MNQKMIDAIVNFFVSIFEKSTPAPVPVPALVPIPKMEVKKEPETLKLEPVKEVLMVDWNNPASKISKHFTVKEATYLNSWGVYHQPTDDQKKAIVDLAALVDRACDILEAKLGKPVQVNVHAWIRPEHAVCPGSQWDNQDYNRWIYWNLAWKTLTEEQKLTKKVPRSPHMSGKAVDFHIIGYDGSDGCAKIRSLLFPSLEELALRMEDLKGGWVHLDSLPVIHNRFFIP